MIAKVDDDFDSTFLGGQARGTQLTRSGICGLREQLGRQGSERTRSWGNGLRAQSFYVMVFNMSVEATTKESTRRATNFIPGQRIVE